ncbi:MAG: DUF2325 domain-containing protein [Candidatus Pelethousia sp.]|nr:DUF2325 domain-containing protein [Candidatus Pelethousia sp.]
MSVIIIGGNECMERLYEEACLAHGYKRAKVFTKVEGGIKKKLGNAELYILFTNTVSHKMVNSALNEAKKCNACVERCHNSSLCALRAVLKNHCPNCCPKGCCKMQQKRNSK